MGDLKEQIHRQSSQIFNLERCIQQQSKEIETKNSIIKALITKLQNNNAKKVEADKNFLLFKIEDLEVKLGLIINQMDQERSEIEAKIDKLTLKVIKYFGKEVWKLKGTIFQFIKENEKKMDSNASLISKITFEADTRILNFQKNLEKLQQNVRKIVDDSLTKESISTTQSKDSLLLPSQKSENEEIRRQESIFSDYFFYPSEK